MDTPATTSRRLNLSVQYACNTDGVPSRPQFRAWARAALNADGMRGGQITLRLVDAEEGQSLNRDYRGKDYATNVLTFTFDEDMPVVPGLPLMGDIVLCAPVVEREAAEQEVSLEAHYCHLIVHGMLHLQGFDHIEDDEAEEMEALESQIVMSLGYDDPYRMERE